MYEIALFLQEHCLCMLYVQFASKNLNFRTASIETCLFLEVPNQKFWVGIKLSKRNIEV